MRAWYDLEVFDIFVKGLVFMAMAAVVISAILFVVGETVEHFTP